MSLIKPLVKAKHILQKYPGKGGWTYAAIPEVKPNKKNPFGWIKVKGKIDKFEFKNYKLMPMGNGTLFLPVKAEIRKYINKQAGDYVNIILYIDDSTLEIPNELIECLKNESEKTYNNFIALTEGEQKVYIDWIYQAKKDETKANRIVKMIQKVEQNLRFHDKYEY